MAAAKVFKNPHTVTYDVTPVTGCVGVAYNSNSGQPVVTLCDDNTPVIWVDKGAFFVGVFTFMDPIQAALIAGKSTAAKNVTFVVPDEAETAYTVTLTAVKTGGVTGNFALGAPGNYAVPFACTGVSDPTAA